MVVLLRAALTVQGSITTNTSFMEPTRPGGGGGGAGGRGRGRGCDVLGVCICAFSWFITCGHSRCCRIAQ